MRIFLAALLALTLSPVAAKAAPSTGRDTPADAPPRQAQLSRQTGGTTLTFREADRRAVLRMDSGGGLDDYGPGPFSVGFDMQGFDASAGPAVVRMSVFDVDEQGAPPDCLPEIDPVGLNGTPIGRLSGSNNGFSLNTFTVPGAMLGRGVNGLHARRPARTVDRRRPDRGRDLGIGQGPRPLHIQVRP